MKRPEAESELDFVGFIVFENKLKPTTTEVMNELNDAGLRKVMCTGDNILTAISVARECHLIDRTAHCFVPRFLQGVYSTTLTATIAELLVGEREDPKARLLWQSVDNPMYELDENTLKV